MEPKTLAEIREQLAQNHVHEVVVKASLVDSGMLTIPAGKTVRLYGHGTLTAEGPGALSVVGRAYASVPDGGGLRVYAYESARVEAAGDCFVRAGGRSHVYLMNRATAAVDATATVTANRDTKVALYGHATAVAHFGSRVAAHENAYVVSHGAHVTAAQSVVVRGYTSNQRSSTVPVFERDQAWSNAEEAARAWCAAFGLPVDDAGIAYVFKGVGDDYCAMSELPDDTLPSYAPGSTPEAPDWDPSDVECGTGLHFSPFPAATLEYRGDATRFLRCPVAVSEMVVLGDKVKAKRVLAPGCVEVDVLGDPV